MAVGRFLAMIGLLVWRRDDGRYLLLRRAANRDYAPGQWETGSGRLDQGEGFIDALHREAKEELGREVRIECILGTTHFYRGDAVPENEMVGLSFGCSIPDAAGLRFSDEHSEHRWVTADDAQAQGKPRVEPGSHLPNQPGPQHELVAGHLGTGWRLLEGRNQ